MEKNRCPWVTNDPIYQLYHDTEWGIEKHTDQDFFEQISLEGAQAGLSWLTVLKKRDKYREIFHGFDVQSCATMSDASLELALLDAGIVRNRLKVYSVRKNALATIQLIKEFGSLRHYFWNWIDETPILLNLSSCDQLNDNPTSTPLSEQISKDLKKRGFSFVGSTIIYAFMQAVGMTVGHSTNCFLNNQTQQ